MRNRFKSNERPHHTTPHHTTPHEGTSGAEYEAPRKKQKKGPTFSLSQTQQSSLAQLVQFTMETTMALGAAEVRACECGCSTDWRYLPGYQHHSRNHEKRLWTGRG